MSPTNKLVRKLPHTLKAAQLGVSPRTLDRWVEAGIIAAPEYVNGRKFHAEDAQPRRDEQDTAA